MIPNDILEGHEMHPALNRAITLANRHYPTHEINIARDGGDVIELFLQDVENLAASNCIHASYNKWYDEITFYSLVLKEGQ